MRLIFSTRLGALSSNWRTSSSHPDRKIPRFSPAFCGHTGQGSTRVPLAERVMLTICRSSTRITSNAARRPCWPSPPRPCTVRLPGVNRAVACRTRPRRYRAATRPGELPLQPPQPLTAPARSGRAQNSNSPGGQGRAERNAPVNAHHLAVAWRRDRIGNSRKSDIPAPGAIHPHTVGPRPTAPRATSGTSPNRPSAPILADVTGHSAHVPLLPRRPVIRNPSSRPALRHDGRPAGLPGSKNAVIARAKSRSACCWTV